VSQEFGLKVRPNHLGMALQRHAAPVGSSSGISAGP
jgi:hypothetical protein